MVVEVAVLLSPVASPATDALANVKRLATVIIPLPFFCSGDTFNVARLLLTSLNESERACNRVMAPGSSIPPVFDKEEEEEEEEIKRTLSFSALGTRILETRRDLLSTIEVADATACATLSLYRSADGHVETSSLAANDTRRNRASSDVRGDEEDSNGIRTVEMNISRRAYF